jgi:hypothetical protein
MTAWEQAFDNSTTFIPLPVRRTDPPNQILPLDLAGLPILATETIDNHQVHFSLVLGQTRFRLTFKEIHPDLIGQIINLEIPNPRLIISEPHHTEWALTNEQALTHHAASIWQANTKSCNR